MIQRVFFWASLVITAGVSAWLTHVARRALRAATPEAPKKEDLESEPQAGSQPADRLAGKSA